MEFDLKKILENFPLRIAITDYCNLNCFFCSNEGMPIAQRNKQHVDINHFEYIIKLMSQAGLRQVSLTGGDPTDHPSLIKIINIINESTIQERFFHTNGVALNRKGLYDGLKDFTKIAISLHASDFATWSRITKGTDSQYMQLRENIEFLADNGFSKKIEIKHVPIRGYNDSVESIKATLDLCSEHHFKFKFLNFEAIKNDQAGMIIPYDELTEKLESAGCEEITETRPFRGQTDYLPARWFSYKGTKGVAIEIGCGNKEVCAACYKSNEIFLTPNLELKPCHASSYTIALKELVVKKQTEKILDGIVQSRMFLYERPGDQKLCWRPD